MTQKHRRVLTTTLQHRARGRVRWQLRPLEYWFVVKIDEDTGATSMYGNMHRQIGVDAFGHLVWPDQSVHDLNPTFMLFFTIRADSMAGAEKLRDAVLETYEKAINDPDRMRWTPPAGLVRGSVETRLNQLEIKQ